MLLKTNKNIKVCFRKFFSEKFSIAFDSMHSDNDINGAIMSSVWFCDTMTIPLKRNKRKINLSRDTNMDLIQESTNLSRDSTNFDTRHKKVSPFIPFISFICIICIIHIIRINNSQIYVKSDFLMIVFFAEIYQIMEC